MDVTVDEALHAAARNLTNAETVTDLALMERLTVLGSAWTDTSRDPRRTREGLALMPAAPRELQPADGD